MDHKRGKIFWRSFADEVHSATLAWLDPVSVDDHDDRVGKVMYICILLCASCACVCTRIYMSLYVYTMYTDICHV